MEKTLTCITAAIADILADNEPSIYLYGSCTQDDFRPGWSDIDLLALTPGPLRRPQAERLLTLRQELGSPDVLYARACEGAILPLATLTGGGPGEAVYWGTSGQRLTDAYQPDCFCLWQLHHGGRLLHGPEVRPLLPKPSPEALRQGVARHLRTILDHGHGGRSLYAFGWLLDTARCLHTLTHGGVISKTAAGEWALREGLCPEPEALRLALAVRRNPALMQESSMLRRAEGLTPAIQGFAGVLRERLAALGVVIPG